MIDFPDSEFAARLTRVQRLMGHKNIDAILLTTEAEIRYFTGFRTQFWQSPTRSWFAILPQSGEITAVIPGIGVDLMQRTWVKDIRSWPSPRGADEGVSLLIDALSGFDLIGLPMGEESSLRMGLTDFETLRSKLKARFIDATPLIKSLRIVKSPAEIAIIRKICAIGSAGFAKVPELTYAGQPLVEVFRDFKIALLQAGADDVPYLVGAAGQGGYGDVISPPTEAPLAQGDVLMLDTGATLQGYFCDFDRNFAIGRVDQIAQSTHHQLWDATETGLTAAKAGMRCCDLFAAMSETLGGGSDVGRIGHGLGMQLTEYPSIAAHDETVLQAGMVMTLEPSLTMENGKIMVHEENILITDGLPEVLTKRVRRDIVVI